jgi:hypothetical protein
LGLLAITLAAFMTVWPLNAGLESWVYYYYGQEGILYPNVTRQFGLLEAIIADVLLPGRAQGIQVIHILLIFGSGLGLFHIIKRLLQKSSIFAYLIASIYLVYIPFNIVHTTGLHGATYTWSRFIAIAASILFLEHTFHSGWRALTLLGIGLVTAHISVHSYESLIPILAAAPFLVVVTQQKVSRRLILAVGMWWSVLGIAAFQFGYSFINKTPETAYQQLDRFVLATSPGEFILDTLDFFKASFSLSGLFPREIENSAYAAIILVLVAGIAMMILWRRVPEERSLPSTRVLLWTFIVGGVQIGLAAFPYVYAGWIDKPRAYFFAAPGQALIIVSLFGLVAEFLRKKFRVAIGISLAIFIGVFFYNAGRWHFGSNQFNNTLMPSFDQRAERMQMVLSVAPELIDNTLLIISCPSLGDEAIQLHFAGQVMYDKNINFLLNPGKRAFDTEGVNYPSRGVHFQSAYYPYDQVVMMGCDGERIYILTKIPVHLLPDDSDHGSYNPYQRVIPSFIVPEKSRILAR